MTSWSHGLKSKLDEKERSWGLNKVLEGEINGKTDGETICSFFEEEKLSGQCERLEKVSRWLGRK